MSRGNKNGYAKVFDKARRAPYDDITGLTCLIAPAPNSPRLNREDPNTSMHHGIFSGQEFSGSFFIAMGDLGLSLAACRVQLVAGDDHNQGPASFHGRYDWSKVSRSEIGKIRTLEFELARAITRRVYDPRIGQTRPITEDERQRFLHSGELASPKRFRARRALTQFTIAHGIQDLSALEVAQYKDMRHEDDKRAVVDETLEKLIPSAFEPIDERYRQAAELRLLPPTAPPTPAELAGFYVMREPERLAMFNDAFQMVWRDGAAA